MPGKQLRGRWAKVADSVPMNDIIGKKQRDWVTSTKGQKYMLQDPTLAEYTSCSERVVTPVGIVYYLLTIQILILMYRFTLKTPVSLFLSSTSIPARQIQKMGQRKKG